MIVNGAAIKAASIGYQALFSRGWESATPHYPAWCMDSQSTGDKETYHLDGGLPEMREWLGERQRNAVKRWTYDLANRDWELTIEIPRNAFADDKLGLFKQRFTQMGVAAKVHPDKLFTDLLVDGFTDKGYDNKAFFGTTHPTLVSGTTNTNKVSGALSEDTFNEAIEMLRSMKDDHAKPIDVFAMGGELELIVPPALESTGREIVVVERLSSGASNPNYQRAKLRVMNRLAGNDAYWYLGLSGGPLRPFIFQQREAAKVIARDQPDDEAMWNRKAIEYGVDGRWAMGYGLYQLMIGSTGT